MTRIPILVNGQIDRREWAGFVVNHPQGNVFQAPGMYDFFASVRNYQPFAAACPGENGKITGILLAVLEREHAGVLGKFSSRAVVWGGPLVAENAGDDVLARLLAAFTDRLGRKAIYLEIRNLFERFRHKEVFADHGFEFIEHLNYHVETAPPAEPRRLLGSNRKRQIKKGLASGAHIAEATKLSQVDELYEILRSLYRSKVRKPLPDRSFFENFFYAGPDLGKIFLVTFAEKVIGGILCPIHESKAIYEWYVCGLDEQYPDQYPSVLATWAAIEYAHGNGIGIFDFMGAGAPGQDYGVREFKSRFGGTLVNFGRYVRINNRLLYETGKLGLKVLGKLKKL